MNGNEISHAMACVVVNKDKDILILKRSPDKKLYPNKWFVVGAYPLTEEEDFEGFAHRELADEIGTDGKILVVGKPIHTKDKMEIIVHPFLAEISTNEIRLNNEHTEFKWVNLEDVKDFDTVPRTYEMISALVTQNE